MAKIQYKTEDQVRDTAKIILEFDKTEAKIQQGTGQITTFRSYIQFVLNAPDVMGTTQTTGANSFMTNRL